MISLNQSTLNIGGAVTHQTVPALLKELQTLSLPDDLNINTAEIAAVDSTAISLIFHILRRCKGHCVLQNPPENLKTLIHLYDLDEHLCPNPAA